VPRQKAFDLIAHLPGLQPAQDRGQLAGASRRTTGSGPSGDRTSELSLVTSSKAWAAPSRAPPEGAPGALRARL